MSDWVKHTDQLLDTISDLIRKRDRVISDLADLAIIEPRLEAHLLILIDRLK